MRNILLALVVPLALQAQEEKKGDPSAAKEAAQKALRATLAKGPFAFSGRAVAEADADDTESEPDAFKISGMASSPFQASLKMRSGKCTQEVYEKGGKAAGRSIWHGKPV